MSIDITFPELDFPFTITLSEGVDTVTHQDAVFYYRTHDEVAVILAAGRAFTVNVCGETRAHVWPTDADCADQNPNSVTVSSGEEWAGAGIRTDVDLEEAADRIVWDYNSWYELRESGEQNDALEQGVYHSIDDAVTGLRDYFAQQGTIHVHANGVVELDPADSRATVCGTCGRAWDDSVSTAWTPAPAARCPFEYDHDGDDEEYENEVANEAAAQDDA